MQPSDYIIDPAAVEAVKAPLVALRPPTGPQFRRAVRVGRHPNELLDEFQGQYDAAVTEAYQMIREIVGADEFENAGPEYRRLSDEVNAVAEERREEWWTTPKLEALKALNPTAKPWEIAKVRHSLLRSWRVDHRITVTPRTTGHAPVLQRMAVGAVAAPRERRDSSSSKTSGQDPGDDDPPGDPVYELVLVDEEAPVSQQPPRFCRCERDRPYAAPDWDIGPDGGHCRSCTRTLRDSDVRRWHAIALSARARVESKGWSR